MRPPPVSRARRPTERARRPSPTSAAVGLPGSAGGPRSCWSVAGYAGVTSGAAGLEGPVRHPAGLPRPRPRRGHASGQEGDSASDIGRHAQARRASSPRGTPSSTPPRQTTRARSGIQVGFYRLKQADDGPGALDVLVDPDNLSATWSPSPRASAWTRSSPSWPSGPTSPPSSSERCSPSRPIGLPAYADGNAEGYLFPATYELGARRDPDGRSCAAMVDRWHQAADDADLRPPPGELGYSRHELMTVASLVQAEGRGDDLPKVARVIYNRLESDRTPGGLPADRRHRQLRAQPGADRPADHRRDPVRLGLAVQHLHPERPAAGPDRGPGDAAIEAAPNPADGAVVLLRDRQPAHRRDQVRRDLRGVPAFKSESTSSAPRSRTAAEPAVGPRRCAVLGDPDRALALPGAAPGGLRRAGSGLDLRRGPRSPRRAWPSFLAGLDDTWRGLSLTMPLKREALRAARRASPTGRAWPGPPTPWCSSDGRPHRRQHRRARAVAALRERYDGPGARGPSCSAAGRRRPRCGLALADLGCAARSTCSSATRAGPPTTRRRRGRHPPAPRCGVGTARGATPVTADAGRVTVPASPRPRPWSAAAPGCRWSSRSSTTRGPPRWPLPAAATAGSWSPGWTCWCTRPRSARADHRARAGAAGGDARGRRPTPLRARSAAGRGALTRRPVPTCWVAPWSLAVRSPGRAAAGRPRGARAAAEADCRQHRSDRARPRRPGEPPEPPTPPSPAARASGRPAAGPRRRGRRRRCWRWSRRR